MEKVNCLSINGGGARGLIALHQLKQLREISKEDITSTFDKFSGTSTGALCIALAVKGYSPSDSILIYEKELPKIFKKGFLRTLRGLSKYDNQYIKDCASNLLGNVKLGDLPFDVMIPALNCDTNETKIFKSRDIRDADYKLSDVVIASAAAPIYFPAHKFGGYYFKDGGLSHNNPSDILLKQCQSEKHKKINILSITTGNKHTPTTKSERKGGVLSVASMINEMLEQQDLKTHGSVQFSYDRELAKGMYVRCESLIIKSSGGIDDVSCKNIQAMKEDGEFSALANVDRLKEFYLSSL
jgi:patatin-like phospholipase/acyl hydrolase